MSRVNDSDNEAGVLPRLSGRVSASAPNATATTVWPAILALLRRPRLRCLATLM